MTDLKYIPVTYWLLGTLFVVFIVQIAAAVSDVPLTEELMLWPKAIINSQNLWGIFTNIFLHGDLGHILLNSWMLFMFGLVLERIVGGRNLLLIFLVCGLFASIFYVLTSLFVLNSATPALGASGAILGVVGAVIALRPRQRVMLLFPPIPMELWMLGLFFIFIALFWFSIGGGTGIAENAHLGGIIMGLIMGWYFRGQERGDPDYDWRVLYNQPSSDWRENYV